MTDTPAYRYLLCDLLTDQPLAELPLSGVSFERRISRVGSFGGSLTASNPDQVEVARYLYENTGRCALWVYRDGQLWWGGIPWTTPIGQGQRGGVTFTVQAATFDSYAHHRVLRQDTTYTQVDDAQIIADLWNRMQSDPRGNIGMDTTGWQPSGTLRDRSYKGTDLAYFGKLIEDLGDVEGGPEHTVDVYLDAAGVRRKALRTSPVLGSPVASVVFQRAARGGGRVLDWEGAMDAVDGGTVFQTRGAAPEATDGNAGEQVDPLLSDLYEAGDLLDAGWPLLDVVADYPDVSELQTLNDHATVLWAQHAGAIETSTYTVQVGNTGWNPNRIGDLVRLKLADAWHTQDTDLTVRPVACKVQAAERGKAETVDLIFGSD